MIYSAAEADRIAGLCEVAPKQFRPLNHIEAATLQEACRDDGIKFAQTVFASLCDAVLSISGRRFTWATVKLYYATFYCLRALLLLNGITIFYRGQSPYSIEARPGHRFMRRKGNSHSVAFAEFNDHFKNDVLLSQPIDNVPALTWMERLRNVASYSTAPFPDPEPPQHFVAQHMRLRQLISAYFAEDVPVLSFQSDHAILAYPILAIRRLNRELEHRSLRVPIEAHYMTILNNADCDVGAVRSLAAFEAV